MAKQKVPRPEPITEGCLADIYRLFFGPLIRYKPQTKTIQEWMEYLFDASNREIVAHIATRPFQIRGLYNVAPLIKIQGIGYRDVKEGDMVWVRRDARNPDCIELEFLGGQGRKDQLFTLNENEWDWAALHLTELEDE